MSTGLLSYSLSLGSEFFRSQDASTEVAERRSGLTPPGANNSVVEYFRSLRMKRIISLKNKI